MPCGGPSPLMLIVSPRPFSSSARHALAASSGLKQRIGQPFDQDRGHTCSLPLSCWLAAITDAQRQSGSFDARPHIAQGS